MNAKKVFYLMFVSIVFPLYAQQAKDVVLVVDTYAGMFNYYEEVGNYLSGQFFAERLRTGDTLHIISFGTRPRLEIVRRVLGQGDIETASARIWLLYPLSPASDPAAALNYAENYLRTITGDRPKEVFIVSSNDLSSLVDAAAARMPPNTQITFIRAGSRMGTGLAAAPGTPGAASIPSSGAVPGTAPSSSVVSSVSPAAAVIPPISQINGVSPQPVADPGSIAPGSISGDQVSAASDPDTSIQPAAVSPPIANNQSDPGARETVPVTGTAGTAASFNGLMSSSFFLPLLIGGAVLLLLLILFIIFRMRNLHSSPSKAMAGMQSNDDTAAKNAALLNSYASQRSQEVLKASPKYARFDNDADQSLSKPPIVNMFVEQQKTAIGKRNVHALKQGGTYSVGGGNSDFLIFLVPFPPRIGQLHFDGKHCTFRPLRPEFFPDIGSNQVPECIGKTIRILSKKRYEVFFRFERYEDPLVLLNQLLHSIKVPEPPGSTSIRNSFR